MILATETAQFCAISRLLGKNHALKSGIVPSALNLAFGFGGKIDSVRYDQKGGKNRAGNRGLRGRGGPTFSGKRARK